ncbi:MAG: 23S rRNA (adenine(2503)-C(2))-methyltransferase RlmN [Bacteroidetes bacterium]|jgi:23S rRNA (adenine2503-C2)-methyltransferase|nr:23S rRNA (adenine(2503)-C(2))-methyltransferase RlmN [Bacteroidota bacterium]
MPLAPQDDPKQVRQDIRSLEPEALQAWFEERGEKAFRARQVYEWLWQHRADSFEQMTNLSKPLRMQLAEAFALCRLEIRQEQRSGDGTIKYAFGLADGNVIEGVLIPQGDRMTACVSSQSGCSLSCKFCATGYLPLKRNLYAYEIVDQVMLIDEAARRHYGKPLTNIVYMGMGEPLLNYRNVLESIRRITAPEGLGMGARRITVSTAGIAKMIRKLGDDGYRSELALSLHAANDQKRSEIMPINETNSLEVLADALRYFYDKTGTRITLEYVALGGVNDSLQDAEELLAFVRQVPSKVNIIEYNPIALADYRASSGNQLYRFKEHLERGGAIVNIRRSRGKDIDAACGQLAALPPRS